MIKMYSNTPFLRKIMTVPVSVFLMTCHLTAESIVEETFGSYAEGPLSDQYGWTLTHGQSPSIAQTWVVSSTEKIVAGSETNSRTQKAVPFLLSDNESMITIEFVARIGLGREDGSPQNRQVLLGLSDFATRTPAHFGLSHHSFHVRGSEFGEIQRTYDSNGVLVAPIPGATYVVRSVWDLQENAATLSVLNKSAGQREFQPLYADREAEEIRFNLGQVSLSHDEANRLWLRLGGDSGSQLMGYRVRMGAETGSYEPIRNGSPVLVSAEYLPTYNLPPLQSRYRVEVPEDQKELIEILPSRNDVTIRTLRFRGIPDGSEIDAFEAVKAFHATRMEWVYVRDADRDRIAAVRNSGRVMGGAASGGLRHEERRKEIASLDLNGEPVIQPHMRAWNNPHWLGDVTNETRFEMQLAEYMAQVELGVETIQRDESSGPVLMAMRNGGGFTKSGLRAFSQWLYENVSPEQLDDLGIGDPLEFDYGDHLRERDAPAGDAFVNYECPIKPYWFQFWEDATADYHQRLIDEVRERAGRPIAYSCNNTSLQLWSGIQQVFDFAISELLLETANPVHIWNRSQRAREVGRMQIFGSPKTRGLEVDEQSKIDLTRQVISTAYSVGMACRVPWDVFQQTRDGAGRYFGKPENYADLTAFVRAHDWNGYEEYAVFGKGLPESDSPLFEISGGTDHVYLFAQKKEHDPDAPPLLFLVDWGRPQAEPSDKTIVLALPGDSAEYPADGEAHINRSTPEPFTLYLSGQEVLGRPDTLYLRRPAPWDEEAHVWAVEHDDYKAMIEEIPLAVTWNDEGRGKVEVPALTPWGVLTTKSLDKDSVSVSRPDSPSRQQI